MNELYTLISIMRRFVGRQGKDVLNQYLKSLESGDFGISKIIALEIKGYSRDRMDLSNDELTKFIEISNDLYSKTIEYCKS